MSSQKTHYVIAILVVLVAAAIAGWYVFSGDSAPAMPSAPVAQPEAPAAPAAAVTTSSLGASILEKTQNPLQDKVPELTPTANPVKDVYKNPFE